MDDNEEPEQITLGHDFPKDLTRNIRGSRVNQTETSFDIPYGDPVKGRNYFMAFCSGCHRLGAHSPLGPDISKIYMSKNASQRGYRLYSGELRSRKFFWTRERLFHFIWDPDTHIPNTFMYFDGMKDSYHVACIVEFLVSLSEQKYKGTKFDINQQV